MYVFVHYFVLFCVKAYIALLTNTYTSVNEDTLGDKNVTTTITAIPRTRTEALDQITAIEGEFRTYAGTDFFKSDRANSLRAHIAVLDRLLGILED